MVFVLVACFGFSALTCRGEVKLRLTKNLGTSNNTVKQREEQMIFEVDRAIGPACDNQEVRNMEYTGTAYRQTEGLL